MRGLRLEQEKEERRKEQVQRHLGPESYTQNHSQPSGGPQPSCRMGLANSFPLLGLF